MRYRVRLRPEMDGVLDILLSASFWAAAIRIATPLIFGVLGALICERAGVLNLGIEGIFTAGAMAGWLSGLSRRRPVGRRRWSRRSPARPSASLHALLTVPLGLSQHVTGIGITLLATSLAYFTYRVALPNVATPPRIAPFQPARHPRPVGPALPRPGAVPADAADLPRPRAVRRRRLRAHPHAARPRDPRRRRQSRRRRGAGADVVAIRIGAVVAGSALMALGGAFLTMSAFNAFFFEMTNGRGWICIALTVFASWRPGKALLGALLFGAFDAFQLRLQHQVGARGAGTGLPDAALPALDRRARGRRAPRRLSEGADDAVLQGRALKACAARSRRSRRDPLIQPSGKARGPRMAARQVDVTHVGSLRGARSSPRCCWRRTTDGRTTPPRSRPSSRARSTRLWEAGRGRRLVVSDGELGKVGYSTYVTERLEGFGGHVERKPALDLAAHPALRRSSPRSWASRSSSAPPASAGAARRCEPAPDDIRPSVPRSTGMGGRARVHERRLARAVTAFQPNQFIPRRGLSRRPGRCDAGRIRGDRRGRIRAAARLPRSRDVAPHRLPGPGRARASCAVATPTWWR